jgi:hypothetical protein
MASALPDDGNRYEVLGGKRCWPNEAESERLSGTIAWHPEPAVPPLVIDLPAYFDRVQVRAT